MVQIFKDMALDSIPSDPPPRLEAPFDYEGVDLLAEAFLVGISNWLGYIDAASRPAQPWYPGFCDVVRLLRGPLSAAFLPNSFSCATNSSLDKDVPIMFREVEFDVMVETSTNTIPTIGGAGTGVYYAEHVSASSEEHRPRSPAPPDQAVGPLERMTSGVSFESDPAPPGQGVDFSIPLDRMGTSSVPLQNASYLQEYKIVVLGEGGVGKSPLIIRFVYDIYEELDEIDFTIEDYYRRETMVDGERAYLEIVDTGSVSFYREGMIETWIKGGQGFILAFRQVPILAEVENLRQEIYQLKGPEAPIVVVGTKSDRVYDREVSATMMENLSRQWGIPFYETSAKHNWGVNRVFEDMVRQMRRRLPPPAPRMNNEEESMKKEESKGGCIVT
ncbi:P-loop containing nucleoside triphosphate hydrolase protein [Mycena maculata]|uniref:P-loop containing nucleoside triphosphate hydrolase protein n=1 Tax=Mycena maculata TaxID=230809 RepID=A0AAD7JS11_9AGAR|nr:P-loop containing nucleoside triphosphate hydrolase protein [Mycena maculata]